MRGGAGPFLGIGRKRLRHMNLSPEETRSPNADSKRGRRSFALVVLLVVTTIVAHFWTIGLEFGLDDFDFVADAARGPSADSYLFGGRPPGHTGDERIVFGYVLRPILLFSLWFDHLVGGADPRIFHAASILYHLAAVLLVFRTLMLADRDDGTPWTAFWSAFFFAVYPGKTAAVAWVGTRGDLLVGLFFLLAAYFATTDRRRSPLRALVLASIAAAAATGSKENGAIVPGLLCVVEVFVYIRDRKIRSVVSILPTIMAMSVISLAYVLLRSLRLGKKAMLYAGESREMTPDVARRMLDDLPETLRSIVAGSFRSSHATDVLTWAALAGFAVVVLLALIGDARRVLIRTALFLPLFLLALMPSLRFLRESSGVDLTRLFYLPSIAWSAILGLLVVAAFRGSTLRKIIVGAAVAAIGVSWSVSAYKTADAFRRASDVTRGVYRSVAEMSAQNPGAAIVCGGLPATEDGAPGIGPFLGQAMRPPFRSEAIKARWFTSVDEYFTSMAWSEIDDPIVTSRWNAAARRIEKVAGPLTRTADSPQKWTGESPNVELALSVVPLSFVQLTIELSDPGPGKDLTIEFRFSNGVVESRKIGANPALSPGVRRSITFVDQAWYLGQEKLAMLVVKTGTPDLLIRSIEFERSVKTIELIESPAQKGGIRLSGDAPIFFFRPEVECPAYRLELMVDGAVASWYFLHSSTVDDGDGRRHWRLSAAQAISLGGPSIEWSMLRGPMLALLDKNGLKSKMATYRITGFRGDLAYPTAFSQMGRIEIIR